MRVEFDVLQQWIQPGSRVLDLGCGDGSLLQSLRDNLQVKGLGIEINHEDFNRCIEKGLSVVEQDLNKGLGNFSTNSFDVVVMSLALQALREPDKVIAEMLRVGKQSIVIFPNFGHWRARWHLISKGRMPVSKFMPYNWYDTPNIHFCTVKDFEVLCRERKIKILNKEVTNTHRRLPGLGKLWPNLFAATAIYHISY